MESLLSHCAALFSEHQGIFVAFFVGGLTGSLTHCLAMCGPMVAGQAACAGGCGKKQARATLSYHMGRMTTYSLLGFFAALLGKQIAATPLWPFLSAIMLVLAGGMFLISSLPGQPMAMCHVNARTNFVRGVLMGFMPCGLIYAALMMAATLASPLAGMAAMAMFVLGTMPVLIFASTGAALLRFKWQPAMHAVGRAAMAVNGIFLLAMAVRTVG